MAVYVPQIIDNLKSTSVVDGLSANQGRVLKEEHGILGDLFTTDKSSLVAAINEIKKTEEEMSKLLDEVNGEII